jgi:hypothetical protein
MQFGMNEDHSCAPTGARTTGQATRHHWGRIFACVALTAALAGVVGPSQANNTDNMSGMPKSTRIPDNQPQVLPDVNKQMQMHEQQAKKQNFEAVNTQRKKIIADESALLLKLATDLKTEVDKTNKDELSLNVIRKADMVEKLAHDMKEKMKLTVGSN